MVGALTNCINQKKGENNMTTQEKIDYLQNEIKILEVKIIKLELTALLTTAKHEKERLEVMRLNLINLQNSEN